MKILANSDLEFVERTRIEEAKFENERAAEQAEEDKYLEEKAEYLYKQMDIETRIKEAYKKIKKQYEYYVNNGDFNECTFAIRYELRLALNTIKEECPEVLEVKE